MTTTLWNLIKEAGKGFSADFGSVLSEGFDNGKKIISDATSDIANFAAEGLDNLGTKLEHKVIEEVNENEYFKDKRLQVSIFMSPINVHVTRYPIGGKILFSKYHPGKYLFAWHPKSSEENERTTVVIENKKIGKLLYRQIAGALARRIVNYAQKDKLATQGNDAGFIKFGSRVDLFLPLDCKIKVKINQKVRGGEDIIAEV